MSFKSKYINKKIKKIILYFFQTIFKTIKKQKIYFQYIFNRFIKIQKLYQMINLNGLNNFQLKKRYKFKDFNFKNQA